MTQVQLADKAGISGDYAPKDGKRRKGKVGCFGADSRSTGKESSRDIDLKRREYM